MVKKHFSLLPMLKTVVLLHVFVESGYFFQDSLINRQHLFEIKIFCNNVFAVINLMLPVVYKQKYLLVYSSHVLLK